MNPAASMPSNYIQREQLFPVAVCALTGWSQKGLATALAALPNPPRAAASATASGLSHRQKVGAPGTPVGDF